jgi:N-acetylmuramoyl-L-alanine amidase
LKWKNPGYHYLIEQTGYEHDLLGEDKIANGVAGYNGVSIHVSYIGGIDKKGNPLDTRTKEQKEALLSRLHALKTRYPNAVIQGHRDFPNVAKACPSFDAKSEYSNL